MIVDQSCWRRLKVITYEQNNCLALEYFILWLEQRKHLLRTMVVQSSDCSKRLSLVVILTAVCSWRTSQRSRFTLVCEQVYDSKCPWRRLYSDWHRHWIHCLIELIILSFTVKNHFFCGSGHFEIEDPTAAMCFCD